MCVGGVSQHVGASVSPCVTLSLSTSRGSSFHGTFNKEIEAKNGHLSEFTQSDPGCSPASTSPPITNHPRDSPGSPESGAWNLALASVSVEESGELRNERILSLKWYPLGSLTEQQVPQYTTLLGPTPRN